MNQVNCPVCGNKCIKAGKTKAGSQRWLCRKCNSSVTHKIDNSAKELQIFLDWLFGKESQSSMPGDGRTFRRKTAKYWNIWPMPPKVEDSRDVLYLDGIYLGRKACILICCDDKYVLGWYLCRYEYAAAWTALMKRIAEPRMVVSDGGTGFAKALKKVWPGAKHQRCVFHVFCQVRRYTTFKIIDYFKVDANTILNVAESKKETSIDSRLELMDCSKRAYFQKIFNEMLDSAEMLVS